MQEAGFGADRAVAILRDDGFGRFDFEGDGAAVAATLVDHRTLTVLRLRVFLVPRRRPRRLRQTRTDKPAWRTRRVLRQTLKSASSACRTSVAAIMQDARLNWCKEISSSNRRRKDRLKAHFGMFPRKVWLLWPHEELRHSIHAEFPYHNRYISRI